MSWVGVLASAIGASEAGLTLILGQLLGYPCMFLYRAYISSMSTTHQHLYFTTTGLLASLWVLGADCLHSVYAILGTYLVLVCAGGTLTSVITSFTFNLGYLLVGYYFTESQGYDICWTMPHCVLTLRLIGLTMDCYDGERARREGSQVLSKEQAKAALTQPPSLLEMLSHSFFLGGYFVGPQFPLAKFRTFVTPEFTSRLPCSPVPYAMNRLVLGAAYMLIHILGNIFLPSDWPASPGFASLSLLNRLLLLPLWCRVILAKYLFVWLFAEGICLVSGLAYNGVGEDGVVDWNGCANVKVRKLETSTRFGNIIESFNINTNNWVATYIYKRLKFLGNRTISQVVTLFFLAVWHGSHSGYYVAFATEFFTIKIEREFLGIWNKSDKVEKWMKDDNLAQVCSFGGWLCVTLLLPHCFIPFSLLTFSKFMLAFWNTWFFLYILYASWSFFGQKKLKEVLLSPKVDKKEEFNKPKPDLLLMSKMKRISEEDPDEDLPIETCDVEEIEDVTSIEKMPKNEVEINAQSIGTFEDRSVEEKKDL